LPLQATSFISRRINTSKRAKEKKEFIAYQEERDEKGYLLNTCTPIQQMVSQSLHIQVNIDPKSKGIEEIKES
jgi:hypothetical protein